MPTNGEPLTGLDSSKLSSIFANDRTEFELSCAEAEVHHKQVNKMNIAKKRTAKALYVTGQDY